MKLLLVLLVFFWLRLVMGAMGEFEVVFSDLQEQDFSTYNTSAWTLDYGPTCLGEETCTETVTECNGAALLGGINSLKEDSQLLGNIQLSNNGEWVSYSQLKISFEVYMIDAWLCVYEEAFLNGQLIFQELREGEGDSFMCGSYVFKDRIAMVSQILDKEMSWGNSAEFKMLARVSNTSTYQYLWWGIRNFQIEINRCGDSCIECNSTGHCSECAQMAFVRNGVCECEDGWIIDTTSKPKCMKCIIGCKKCSDLVSCDEWERSDVEIATGFSGSECSLDSTGIVSTGWNNAVEKEYCGGWVGVRVVSDVVSGSRQIMVRVDGYEQSYSVNLDDEMPKIYGQECGEWGEHSGIEVWSEIGGGDVVFGGSGAHTIEVEWSGGGNWAVQALKVWVQECDEECKGCSGSSWRECSSCMSDAELVHSESGSWSWCECVEGKVMIDGECKECGMNCNNCVGQGESECVVCVDGYEVQTASSVIRFRKSGGVKVEERVSVGICIEVVGQIEPLACGENEFKYQEVDGNGDLVSEECVEDCGVKNQYGNNGNCVGNCVYPYVGNGEAMCIYEYECVSGQESYVEDSSGVRICSDCGALFGDCLKCGDVEIGSNVYEMQCLECESELILEADGKGCVEDCPEGSFLNEYKKKCVENCEEGWFGRQITREDSSVLRICVIDCKLNDDDTSSNCYNVNGVCLPVSGFYSNSDTNECSECQSHCLYCSSADSCYLCENGYFLLDGTGNNLCVDNCGDEGLYEEDNKCVSECSDGLFASSSNYKCVADCPSHYYGQNKVCHQCNGDCLECFGSSSSNCLSCNVNSYLENNECKSDCSDGKFKSGLVCVDCDRNCMKCDVSSDNCVECWEGQFLSGGDCATSCPNGKTPALVSGVGICATSCQDISQYYLQTLDKCVENCPESFEQDDDTMTCINNDNNNECEGDNYYWDDGQCYECNSACLTCYGGSSDECTSCPEGSFLENNKCLTNCGDGKYKDNFNRICQNCPQGCSECSSASDCSECNSGYYYYSKNCYQYCPSGTYIQDFECIEKCASPYYVTTINNQQVCTCCQCPNAGEYYNQSSNKCMSCPTNCKSCASFLYCDECNEGLWKFQGQCAADCPYGFFKEYYYGESICSEQEIVYVKASDIQSWDKEIITFNFTYDQAANVNLTTKVYLQNSQFNYNLTQTKNNSQVTLEIFFNETLQDQIFIWISLKSNYQRYRYDQTYFQFIIYLDELCKQQNPLSYYDNETHQCKTDESILTNLIQINQNILQLQVQGTCSSDLAKQLNVYILNEGINYANFVYQINFSHNLTTSELRLLSEDNEQKNSSYYKIWLGYNNNSLLGQSEVIVTYKNYSKKIELKEYFQMTKAQDFFTGFSYYLIKVLDWLIVITFIIFSFLSPTLFALHQPLIFILIIKSLKVIKVWSGEMVWTVFNDSGYENYYFLNEKLNDLDSNFWINSKIDILILIISWGISLSIHQLIKKINISALVSGHLMNWLQQLKQLMCWNFPLGMSYILCLRVIVKGINGLNTANGIEFWMSLVPIILILLGFLLFLLKMLFVQQIGYKANMIVAQTQETKEIKETEKNLQKNNNSNKNRNKVDNNKDIEYQIEEIKVIYQKQEETVNETSKQNNLQKIIIESAKRVRSLIRGKELQESHTFLQVDDEDDLEKQATKSAIVRPIKKKIEISEFIEDFHKDKKSVAVINIDGNNNKQTQIVRDSAESFHCTARDDQQAKLMIDTFFEEKKTCDIVIANFKKNNFFSKYYLEFLLVVILLNYIYIYAQCNAYVALFSLVGVNTAFYIYYFIVKPYRKYNLLQLIALTLFLMDIIFYSMIYLAQNTLWNKIGVRIMLGWMFVAIYWLLNSVYFLIAIKEFISFFRK